MVVATGQEGKNGRKKGAKKNKGTPSLDDIMSPGLATRCRHAAGHGDKVDAYFEHLRRDGGEFDEHDFIEWAKRQEKAERLEAQTRQRDEHEAAAKVRRNRRAKPRQNAKLGHVPISDEIIYRKISEIRPSPLNDRLYRRVDPNDPENIALAESIAEKGVLEALTITTDDWIISGHRRYSAAKVAGLDDVPCRVAAITHNDPRFLAILRDANRQRVKSLDEVLREEVVSANPTEAHRALREQREQLSRVTVDTIALGAAKRRARITEAKRPFLDAIIRIFDEYRDYWPLSVRQVHYYLLNYRPLIHAGKLNSAYANDKKSYKSLDELLTRARLAGDVPFEAIHDSTRPVVTWNVHRDTGPFVRAHLDKFLKGYYRDLMQSQVNHIEICGEKNTVDGVIRPVAMQYTLPYSIGRGYSSLPPRYDIAARFRRSGKERLILLFLSDFDPEGEDIGRAFAQSMRDDFGIEAIEAVKVTLTADQVQELNLPPMMQAKETSSRYDGFVERHGTDVFELEAIPPATLQHYLRNAIDSIINVNAYNAELDKEARDAAFLETVRRRAHEMLGNLGGIA